MNARDSSSTTLTQQLLYNSNLQVFAVIILLIAVAIAMMVQTQQPRLCELFEGYTPTTTEQSRVLIALGKANLNEYSVQNGNIWIPPSLKPKYLAAIHDEDALPQALQKEKEASTNPFLPKSQQNAIALDRKKRQIRDMIQRLPFVQEAWFEMDRAASDSVYQPDVHSAVVMVTLNDSKALTRQQVVTIQGIVGGSIAKIKPNQVVVTDANMGISYHDLNDTNQSELIDLVNWKMSRRIHYMERMQEFIDEFPGIQIDIDVRIQDRLPAQPRQVSKPPAKLANAIKEITLNGSGEVAHASYLTPNNLNGSSYSPAQPAIHVTSEKIHSSNRESLVVHVRVPEEFAKLSKTENRELAKNGGNPAELFKIELSERIRDRLGVNPSETPLTLAVSILPLNQNGLVPSPTKRIPDAVKRYWPLAAVLVIGIGVVILNRKPNSPLVANDRNALEVQPAPEDLQVQLNELIDKDPEAAAKVLKNWIRDAN